MPSIDAWLDEKCTAELERVEYKYNKTPVYYTLLPAAAVAIPSYAVATFIPDVLFFGDILQTFAVAAAGYFVRFGNRKPNHSLLAAEAKVGYLVAGGLERLIGPKTPRISSGTPT